MSILALATRAQLTYEIVTGIALIMGLAGVIYTLPKVKPWWKPAYWLAIPLSALAVATFANGMAQKYLGLGFGGLTTLYMLQVVLALTAIELILVPYIHRREVDKL